MLKLSEQINAFSVKLEGMSKDVFHAEGDISELKDKFETFKDKMWDLVNGHTDAIKDLTNEDKLLKVKLATGHKFMVWLSMILSVLAGLYTLLKEVVSHAP